MILISHRGNTSQINIELENTEDYIDAAIAKGYEVEIDIWKVDAELYLGHDEPENKVDLKWLEKRKDSLWIHTKNRAALEFFVESARDFKFFWHTVDPLMLTSNGKIWAHDYEDVENEQLCIVPLLSLEQVEAAVVRPWYAICTDFPDQCAKKWKSKGE